MEREIFYGSEYDDPSRFGNFTLSIYDDKLAMAISVGGEENCHPYTDLNEDSCAYLVKDNYRLAVVVDAHSGNWAGIRVVDAVIDHVDELFDSLDKRFTAEILRVWMNEIIYPVSDQIVEDAKLKPFHKRSKTQMSLVIARDDRIVFAQFGDTRIYTTSQNCDYTIAPVIKSSTLGYPMTEEDFNSLLVTDTQLWDADAIIICSDGFAEADFPEYDPETVISWIENYTTAEEICKSMMSKAFELGACDNLSVIAITK